MAKQTTVTLIDDLDGGAADEQIEFSVDGKSYEIDLSAKNSKRLRSLLEPYISAGRRVTAARRAAAAAPATRTVSDRRQNQAVREWAVGQGLKISERGRIPSNVLEAYHAAH